MNVEKDYYAILGVLRTAEDIVIRAAYKALAQRYHPDRFEGPKDEATRMMQELNEAYAVLSDPKQRKEYDALRGAGTQSGDSYFGDESSDVPPHFDPLEKDWALAVKYYPDLTTIEGRLTRIAWRLGYSFRAYMLEEKAFEKRKQVADAMEQIFLQSYFGTNPKLVEFAKELILRGHKSALRALNEAIRVLGSGADPLRVVAQVKKDHRPLPFSAGLTEYELTKHFGISFDGYRYRWKGLVFVTQAEAIEYASAETYELDEFWAT